MLRPTDGNTGATEGLVTHTHVKILGERSFVTIVWGHQNVLQCVTVFLLFVFPVPWQNSLVA